MSTRTSRPILAVLVVASGFVTSASFADVTRTVTGSVCVLGEDSEEAYHSAAVTRGGGNFFLSAADDEPRFVSCPVMRDDVSSTKTLQDLDLFAEPGYGECTLYGISKTGSVLDSNTRQLASDGSTDFNAIDVGGSTTAHFVLGCSLTRGARIYSYKYREGA